MRALRQHRIGAAAGRCAGRAIEQRDIGRRRLDQHRRREIPRVAGMEGSELERLVGKAGARAELIGIDILPHLVEAQAGIHVELVGELPLVLDIDAGEPAEL